MRNAQREDLALFQALCHEAATRCGPDIRGIEFYVEEALGRLPPARQRALRRSIAAMLRQQESTSVRPGRLN